MMQSLQNLHYAYLMQLWLWMVGCLCIFCASSVSVLSEGKGSDDADFRGLNHAKISIGSAADSLTSDHDGTTPKRAGVVVPQHYGKSGSISLFLGSVRPLAACKAEDPKSESHPRTGRCEFSEVLV